MSGGTIDHDLEVCLKSEQDARDQIVKDWPTYSAAEKTQRIQPSVYLPSYIEWLTCLEMPPMAILLKFGMRHGFGGVSDACCAQHRRMQQFGDGDDKIGQAVAGSPAILFNSVRRDAPALAWRCHACRVSAEAIWASAL